MTERISRKDFKEKFGGDLGQLTQRLALQSKPNKNLLEVAETQNKILLTPCKGQRIIGIDTGVNTGVAIWYDEFEFIGSMMIHRAIEMVLKAKPDFVRVEDARLYRHYGKTNPSKIQGAGSVKRDALIWEDVLTDYGIKFELVSPADNTTKLPANQFKLLTGWNKKTSEHGRDAAMLVWNHVQA